MKRFELLVALIISVACSVQVASAQGVPAPYTSRLQTVYTGLSRPILLRGARDGSNRRFVLQQGGQIRVFQPGAATSTVFIDLSSKIIIPVSTGDERGLLGLTFHPQFATNGKFYVNYTQVGTGTTIVAEYLTTTGNGNSNTGDINSERILFTVPQPFSNHNGGMIDFGLDGYLYIGMGDGGSANDPGNRAQNRSQLLGKILRIDPNSASPPYAIPPTNPFTGANTARCDNGSTTSGSTCQEIWAIGMRNPWRWSFDRTSGQLWAGDVGQGAIEELDIITSGSNYGWRVYEGLTCTGLDPSLCVPANYTMPFFTYSHTSGRCSVTGGYVYRGTQGSLPGAAYTYADYCTGEIWMWNNNAQTLLQDTPRNVVSFGEDDEGEVFVCYNNGQIDRIIRAKASADFDGDLKTDVSVFRPSTGVWYVTNSSNNSIKIQQFGLSGDTPTPEDYDGDNITDISVYRASTNAWYYFQSSDATVGAFLFGSSDDIPAQGDFDGDAKADLAVFRPSTGTWWIRRTTAPNSFFAVPFGLAGDIPTQSDYDGDGKYDIAVFRPTNGFWYQLNSSNGAFTGVNFGLAGDVPTQGDFDGDGKADQAVFRPATGVWYQLRSTSGFFAAQWGVNADVPVVGDYDGDGRDDIAVYRPATGVWYASASASGPLILPFGLNGDLPSPRFDAP